MGYLYYQNLLSLVMGPDFISTEVVHFRVELSKYRKGQSAAPVGNQNIYLIGYQSWEEE